MKRAQKRAHLVETAVELFNRLGYHGAGIDRVIAEAGIAKTTLYRHFKSKEELIVAVLRRIDENQREKMREIVEREPRDPEEKILATFDFLDEWYKDEAFYGCAFISAASEYSERPGAVFQEAAMHKRLVVAYFEELARAAHISNPQRFAEEINLLHEGATAIAHITGDAGAAFKAKEIAARLIEDAREQG